MSAASRPPAATFPAPAVASTGLATLTVNTGPAGGGSTAGDSVFVRSTVAGVTTTVNGDGGADLLRVASFTDTLDTILGALTVNGNGNADTLQFGDENVAGPTAGFTYTITATAVNRPGAAAVTYGTVETLLLDARNATPPAGNTINVTGTASGAAYTINAGSGNDAITVSGGGANLTVNGQGGTDTL